MEVISSADLGGSSKYSNENFEDRSGVGFHVNSIWTWIRRSLERGIHRTRRLCFNSRMEIELIFLSRDVDNVR